MWTIKKASNLKRYQPLSENYRWVDNKILIQQANSISSNNQYNLIGRAGSRGSNLSSVTPQSSRKEFILSRLKENYKNADLSKNGYYVPPNGLNKITNSNSQKSQPILGGLRNNLSKRYISNQYSSEISTPQGLQPKAILNQKRIDTSSVRSSRISGLKQSNSKPMSAQVPSWWG